jgi:hypothetical protein
VQQLHPADGVVLPHAACRPQGRDAGGQARELALEGRQVLGVQIVPDEVHSEVPALRALIGPFDLRGNDRRVTGRMMPSAASRSRAVRTVRSDRSV